MPPKTDIDRIVPEALHSNQFEPNIAEITLNQLEDIKISLCADCDGGCPDCIISKISKSPNREALQIIERLRQEPDYKEFDPMEGELTFQGPIESADNNPIQNIPAREAELVEKVNRSLLNSDKIDQDLIEINKCANCTGNCTGCIISKIANSPNQDINKIISAIRNQPDFVEFDVMAGELSFAPTPQLQMPVAKDTNKYEPHLPPKYHPETHKPIVNESSSPHEKPRPTQLEPTKNERSLPLSTASQMLEKVKDTHKVDTSKTHSNLNQEFNKVQILPASQLHKQITNEKLTPSQKTNYLNQPHTANKLDERKNSPNQAKTSSQSSNREGTSPTSTRGMEKVIAHPNSTIRSNSIQYFSHPTIFTTTKRPPNIRSTENNKVHSSRNGSLVQKLSQEKKRGDNHVHRSSEKKPLQNKLESTQTKRGQLQKNDANKIDHSRIQNFTNKSLGLSDRLRAFRKDKLPSEVKQDNLKQQSNSSFSKLRPKSDLKVTTSPQENSLKLSSDKKQVPSDISEISSRNHLQMRNNEKTPQLIQESNFEQDLHSDSATSIIEDLDESLIVNLTEESEESFVLEESNLKINHTDDTKVDLVLNHLDPENLESNQHNLMDDYPDIKNTDLLLENEREIFPVLGDEIIQIMLHENLSDIANSIDSSLIQILSVLQINQLTDSSEVIGISIINEYLEKKIEPINIEHINKIIESLIDNNQATIESATISTEIDQALTLYLFLMSLKKYRNKKSDLSDEEYSLLMMIIQQIGKSDLNQLTDLEIELLLMKVREKLLIILNNKKSYDNSEVRI